MQSVDYNDEKIIIYDFEEAEEVIRQTAIENAGDITTVARGGRGRNKVEYYNYPCSFDIETTTIRPGDFDYIGTENDPPIAFPYLFQWNIYGRVIMCRQYAEAEKIFEWLSYYFRTAKNRRLVIFDMNLNYEYFFFKDIWEVDPDGSFAIDDKHPVTILTEDGLMFRDAFKMTNMGLETLTKDWSKHYIKMKEIMNYDIVRTPYTELDDNTLLYSALDVLSLSEAIANYLEARNEGIYTSCPTSTSFIRKNLKKAVGVTVKNKLRTLEQKRYGAWLEKQKISYEQFKMLLRAARGGNTHANRAYTGKLVHCVHFDICSSYPAQMVCYPEYPVSIWRELNPGTEVEEIELLEANQVCTLFDVVLFNPRLKPGVTVPYISLSKLVMIGGGKMDITDNGRYISGLHKIQLSIFGIEWHIIKQQYDYDDAIITRGYYAHKGYLPDDLRKFIIKLYAQKTELKNVPSKAIEYAIAKTYVNGVFGMSMTNNITRPNFNFTSRGIIETAVDDPIEELNRYQASKGYFVPYAVGCLCAALGRVYLQKMIDAVGKNFVYCDTDSVFALDPEGSRAAIKDLEEEIVSYQRKCGIELTYYDIKGKPHELGSIDEEAECDLKTWGSKKYITIENGVLKCTVAGVPKKKGAEVIGTPDNFKLGLNFPGTVTGKKCLWYNEAPRFKLHDEQGRVIDVRSNVAMLPCDYLLGISSDYEQCLHIEGNFNWKFREGDKNIINEGDYQ